MTMISTLDNPLAANPLPARTAQGMSTDAPTAGPTRPFGLTRVQQLGDGEGVVSVQGVSYDPDRQLSVDADGNPLIAASGAVFAATKTDTKYDMTWVVDAD
jgi:putative ATP-grasp target RiPP